jgi:hypothetical protein
VYGTQIFMRVKINNGHNNQKSPRSIMLVGEITQQGREMIRVSLKLVDESQQERTLINNEQRPLPRKGLTSNSPG